MNPYGNRDADFLYPLNYEIEKWDEYGSDM